MKNKFFVAWFVLLCVCFTTEATENSFFIEKHQVVYQRAQVVCWLSEESFAVGRWDGSISIFNFSHKNGDMKLQQTLTPNGNRGVRMIAALDKNCFISSGTDHSLVIWEKDNHESDSYNSKEFSFETSYGCCTSAYVLNDGCHCIVGHDNGILTLWKKGSGDRFELLDTICLRETEMNDEVLYSVNSVVGCEKDKIITGSEDGNLCLVSIADDRLSLCQRQKYSEVAQRGINHLSYSSGFLLLGNCSVGNEDKNLWLYKIEDNNFFLLDAVNLIHDKAYEQVFNFSVSLFRHADSIGFLASTQEGLLWYGSIKENKLAVEDCSHISGKEGGAAFALHPKLPLFVAAEHDIHIFAIKGP